MRIKNLDLLRGVAVVLVLGQHFEIAPVWSKIGWIGVDLFFVLSGYLVAGLLFAEYKKQASLRVGRFYARRGFKIYPAFYALMACTVIWQHKVVGEVPPKQLVAELLFFQNYVYGFWWHTWSLAVEEHFYLLLPLVLLALIALRRQPTRDPFTAIPGLFVAVAVLTLIGRIMIVTQGEWPYWARYATHLRIDSLLFGVLLSYGSQFKPAVFQRLRDDRRITVAAVFGLLVCLGLIVAGEKIFTYLFGYILLYIGFGSILLVSLREPKRAAGGVSKVLIETLAFIGFYSYSIYLWHMAMKDWGLRLALYAVKRLNSPALITAYGRVEWIIYILGSIAVGVVMAKLIEMPFLRLRDWLLPSKGDRSNQGNQDDPGRETLRVEGAPATTQSF